MQYFFHPPGRRLVEIVTRSRPSAIRQGPEGATHRGRDPAAHRPPGRKLFPSVNRSKLVVTMSRKAGSGGSPRGSSSPMSPHSQQCLAVSRDRQARAKGATAPCKAQSASLVCPAGGERCAASSMGLVRNRRSRCSNKPPPVPVFRHVPSSFFDARCDDF